MIIGCYQQYHQPRLQRSTGRIATWLAATGDRGACLAIPLILHRFNDQRRIAALVSLLCAVGAAGALSVPGQRHSGRYRSASVQARDDDTGLTFIGLSASSAHQAAALSGMAQSVGI